MENRDIRKQNLKYAVQFFGGVGTLAEKADCSKKYLEQILQGFQSGKDKNPRKLGDNIASKIAKALGKEPYWIDQPHPDLWEKSGIETLESQVKFDENVSVSDVGVKKIPLIDYVRAGTLVEVANPFPVGGAYDWLLTDLDLSERAFALEIEGNSMEPEFKAGDRVIIDPSVSPHPGDFVVAKNHDEKATFKKYRLRGIDETGKEVFELIPLNSDYPTLRSDEIPLRIIGTMMEHRKYRRR